MEGILGGPGDLADTLRDAGSSVQGRQQRGLGIPRLPVHLLIAQTGQFLHRHAVPEHSLDQFSQQFLPRCRQAIWPCRRRVRGRRPPVPQGDFVPQELQRIRGER